MTRTTYMSGKNYLKYCFLFVFSTLVVACTSNTNDLVFQGQDTTGTVEVHLNDPLNQFVPVELQQSLSFTGIDSFGSITYGPVTREFQNIVTLSGVPVQTSTLIVETSAGGDAVFAEAPVFVDPGGLSYVTDLVPREARAGDVAAISAQGDGSPVAVGSGFIQTRRSEIGERGANGVMAGARAFSVTSSLPFPYRTNSWLTPLMAADNASTVFLGDSFNSGDPLVAYQLPVYPHPWAFRYRNDGVSHQGLLLTPERVRTTAGAAVPGPAGPGENSSSQMAEIQSTLDVDAISVDPGFLSYAMKVNRQGDYDCELIMRSLDDRDHDLSGLSDAAALSMGVVRGSPFLYFTAHDLPQVSFRNFVAGEVINNSGTVQVGDQGIDYNVLTAPYADSRTLTTVLLWPSGTASYTPSPNIDSSIVFNDPNGDKYFVIAWVPEAPGEAALTALAEAAFSYPTNSTVTYNYNQAGQYVDAEYVLTTQNVLGLPESTLSGLLPHHYFPSPVHNNDPILVSSNAPFNVGSGQMSFLTPRGDLKVFQGGSYTCRYPFSGVLPALPALDAGDTSGQDELAAWIDVFIRRHGSDNPPYTNTNAGRGQSAYPLLKFLGRNVLAANVIESAGETALATQVRDETREAIELYFQQTPAHPPGLENPGEGQAPPYFYYDPEVGCLNQYPASLGASIIFPADTNDPPWDEFGSISRCNDHHFHYGYMINAAAQIAIADPTWGANWKDAINQLVFDVANDPAVNPNPVFEFPKTRNWDPWMNHGMASGFSFADNIGNNEESISEHINFWAGVILWAGATDQPALMDHAIGHYAAAVHSSFMYWYDPADLYQSIIDRTGGLAKNWPGNGGSRIFDAFTRWDTFFGIHPAAGRGITMFPMTPGHFYHAMNLDYVAQVTSDYDNFLTSFDIDPLNPSGFADWRTLDNPWLVFTNFYGVITKYAALADPDNALDRYYPAEANYDVFGGIVPHDKLTDIGDSGVFIYHFVRYMQTFGRPDPWVTATNTPFYMTFLDPDTGDRTYVAFNHTDAVATVTFSDGGMIEDIPARTVGSVTVSP